MNKREIITSFVQNRPEAIGAYGYGSGVFRQEGYQAKDKPQIDIIFVVDDLKDWHLQNVDKNKDDYPMLGRVFLNRSSIKDLKGRNNITYYSQIYENGYRFKYGVVEETDFLSSLINWDKFFIAGRFQKPTLRIVGSDKEEEAIKRNKEQALLVAALLSPSLISRKNFFRNLCSLSYTGTLRMYVAENPNKVNNIVNGNYEMLNQIYNLDVDFIECQSELIAIDHHKALRHVKELPTGLLLYLYEAGYDTANLESIRNGISSFLYNRNKTEELNQTFDTLKTNGVVRSTPYILAKVKKRIAGK